jgi:hypothetical protein
LNLWDTAQSHVTINPEKSGVHLSADLARALSHAESPLTGASFDSFLNAAAATDRKARQRKRVPVTAVEPRGGLPESVLSAYRRHMDFRDGYSPIDIRWNKLPPTKVFDINFEPRVLELNTLCRHILVGRQNSTDPNDAPLFKVLLHLLLEKFFAGQHLGPKDRLEIDAWNAVMFAAANAQAQQNNTVSHPSL